MDDTLLRKVQLVELEITQRIAHVCDELGITWFLDGGSVLGAARHQGFIPWDDDMDLGMLWNDYETFRAKAPELLGPDYELQDRALDPRVRQTFMKVRKRGTLMQDPTSLLPPERQGIWVDIFPFYRMDQNDALYRKLERKRALWTVLKSLRVYDFPPKGQKDISGKIRRLVHKSLRVLPEELFYEKAHELTLCTNPDGQILTCFEYSPLLRLPYEEAFPLATLPFEGIQMPVFHNWELYLTSVYGDWRTPPKPEDRHGHLLENVVV